jgi:hypothetical protein
VHLTRHHATAFLGVGRTGSVAYFQFAALSGYTLAKWYLPFRWKSGHHEAVLCERGRPETILSSSPSNIWILGFAKNGTTTAIRWTGHRRSRVRIPDDAFPTGGVVLGASNVWLVANDGVEHWDGAGWRLAPVPATLSSAQLSGTASRNLWLAGVTGGRVRAYRWQRGAWRLAGVPRVRAQESCIVAQSDTSVWIGAQTLQVQPWRWDGRKWHHVRPPRHGTNGCLLAPFGKDGMWADESNLWTGTRWLAVDEGELSYPVDSPVLVPIPGTDLTWNVGFDDGAVIMRTVRT